MSPCELYVSKYSHNQWRYVVKVNLTRFASTLEERDCKKKI